MSVMTKDQLNEHIKTVVLPAMKDLMDKSVREIVQENVSKQLETSRHSFLEPMLERLNPRPQAVALTTEQRSLRFAKCLRAYGKAKLDGAGPDAAYDILKKWGDEPMANEYKEMRAKALAASDAVAGGFIVPETYSTDIVEFLRPRSVIRAMGPTIIPMSTGSFRIPKVTGGTSFSYIGENRPAPVSQPTFGAIQLTFKKLAGLVPMSNDLLRYSSPGADAIVRDDVVNGMAYAENVNFMRGDGTGGTPKGLLNWVLPDEVIIANATQSMTNIVNDLGALIVVMLNKNLPMVRPGWLMAPRTWNYLMTLTTTNGVYPFRDEVMNMRLWGWPIGMTTSVPINLNGQGRGSESEIYLVDWNDVALGESQNLIIDASQEAAYTDGGILISAYQNDQTVIRAIAEHDLVMRRQESVAMLTGVVYGK